MFETFFFSKLFWLKYVILQFPFLNFLATESAHSNWFYTFDDMCIYNSHGCYWDEVSKEIRVLLSLHCACGNLSVIQYEEQISHKFLCFKLAVIWLFPVCLLPHPPKNNSLFLSLSLKNIIKKKFFFQLFRERITTVGTLGLF